MTNKEKKCDCGLCYSCHKETAWTGSVKNGEYSCFTEKGTQGCFHLVESDCQHMCHKETALKEETIVFKNEMYKLTNMTLDDWKEMVRREERTALIEKVEGMRKEQDSEGWRKYGAAYGSVEQERNVYNRALDDVLALLREKG